MSALPTAILGATSQLARDFVAQGAAQGRDYVLFARRPEALANTGHRTAPLDAFGDEKFAAIVNFIGVGDPQRARDMGSTIIGITDEWDARVLKNLQRFPASRYVFLSSGAAYGNVFSAPASAATEARFAINALGRQDFYGLAKLAAETRHRAAADLGIIDVRIFNYISRTQDLAARYFVTDMIRAALAEQVFSTRKQMMVRDYIGPSDLAALIVACLDAPQGYNGAVDAYSRAPINKAEMLNLMATRFGLRFEYDEGITLASATGEKSIYCSAYRAAAALGFEPQRTSAQALFEEIAAIPGMSPISDPHATR